MPQAGGSDLKGVGAKRDPVQAPAGSASPRIHTAITHEVTRIADREDVAHEALRRPHTGDRVEREVAVLVLRIDGIVVATAARPNVAQCVRHELPVFGGGAERQGVDHDAARGIGDAVDHAVGENALVVERRAPGVRAWIALVVEPPRARAPNAGVRRVARGTHGKRRRREGEGILEDAPEVEQHRCTICLSGAAGILPNPELQELDPREIDARGRERLSDRTPARRAPRRSPKSGEPRRLFARPSTLSGCSVNHKTGSAACA